MQQVDIAIVGGGMVGAALALALGQSRHHVTLLERQPPAPWCGDQPHDLRVSAISPGSAKLLDELGAWEGVLARRAAPYTRLRTWERRGMGDLQVSAQEMGCAVLGHIVENRIVQLALWEQIERQNRVEIVSPCQIRSIERKTEGSEICLADGQRLTCKLLVGADGAASSVRSAAGIGTRGWEYRQQALIAYVETYMEQQTITWQRFLPNGPQALLPLTGGHASLVWYERPDRVQTLVKLSDAELVNEIERAFPKELGGIRSLKGRTCFMLKRQHALTYGQPGVVLVGDAAHAIHPLAGQGVNLGFKDVAALAEILPNLTEDCLVGGDWLRDYERQRRWDNSLMMNSMELFQRGFAGQGAPIRLARNVALALAQRAGPLKQHAVRWAMGI